MFHFKTILFVLTGFIFFVSACKTPPPKDPWIVPSLKENEKLFLAPLKVDEFVSKDLGGKALSCIERTQNRSFQTVY
ncbi:hypothetical protein LEP1GSC145_3965 [Leptospira interrogans serovar Djasiman str. LT1649]|nr:hypothetical protein LEP1GSC148_3089 [Leptospira interrogans serovar Canicola str. LT1962]EMM91140.1 hypothetical protein LEP1GSC145_3965 [Leptospira interrogans serovar Djasiman str. LT1649]